MNTIRRKISTGFIALTFVLFCAVALNVFELRRMSREAEESIQQGNQGMEYATRMLDALQNQNRAILNMVIHNDSIPSANYNLGTVQLGSILLEAQKEYPGNAALEKIENSLRKYNDTIEQHTTDNSEDADRAWFMDTYVEDYYALDSDIKAYMTSPKTSESERISELEENVYKTITPSVLTLLVAVIILLMFFFFIDTYYTKPVRRISKALDNTLKNSVPYQVKIDEQNEISQLNDNIAEMVSYIRKQK
jgi:methyl-accepting chemotaxis protein